MLGHEIHNPDALSFSKAFAVRILSYYHLGSAIM